MAGIDPELVVSTVVNRLDQPWAPPLQTTALHLAVESDHKPMVSLLVNRGAKVDSLDFWSNSPLYDSRKNHDSGISDTMAYHLIELGASTVPLILWRFRQRRSDVFSQLLHMHFKENRASGKSYRDILRKSSTTYSTTIESQQIPTDPATSMALARMGYDLTAKDKFGRSHMHALICNDKHTSLILNGNYGLEMASPIPWHIDYWHFGRRAFISTSFQHFRRRLGNTAFRHLLNLHPTRGWSPLCRAASQGNITVMQNCLSMGAEIDFEGCAYGTALMVASASGLLEGVEFLVRRGAAIAYIGEDGPTDALSLTRSKVVKAWLLVGRFTDQRRLTGSQDDARTYDDASEPQVRHWSGTALAKLRLVGRLEMQAHESLIDYMKRSAGIRRNMRGKVVQTVEALIYPDVTNEH